MRDARFDAVCRAIANLCEAVVVCNINGRSKDLAIDALKMIRDEAERHPIGCEPAAPDRLDLILAELCAIRVAVQCSALIEPL